MGHQRTKRFKLQSPEQKIIMTVQIGVTLHDSCDCQKTDARAGNDVVSCLRYFKEARSHC